MARDFFHHTVKNALMKDGWIITHDPYPLQIKNGPELKVDLGAEQLLSAERGNCKMALNNFQEIIIQVLEKYAQIYMSSENIETQMIIDKVNNHFLLLKVGWDGLEQIYNTLMHFDIKENKIWIQKNSTEELLDKDLFEFGVPKSDIVLGLQPPAYRKFTEFAVA